METPQPVIDQREVVQKQWLNTLNEMNKYVNMALDMGKDLGRTESEENTDTTVGNVKYAIQLLENMLDSCETPQETLEGLRKFIGVGEYNNPPNTDDESPF